MKKPNKAETRSRITLHWLFTSVILIEILAVIAIATGLATLSNNKLDGVIHIPPFLWVLIFASLLGSIATYLITYFLLNPIKALSKEMKKVAEGNFDITIEKTGVVREMKDLYASFNLMTRELRSTEVLQRDFVSNVSHEFKTPLATIEGYATLLQDKTLTEEEREEYIEKIRTGTSRLSDLVRNILLLSKVENQVIEKKPEAFRLDEEIRQAILSLESEWTRKSIVFDIELDPVLWVGNEVILRHVWTNIISNAIKFNSDGGFVGVTLTDEIDCVVFTVTDNGPGIRQEDADHIFERFYQGDTSHREEGNGLGLALTARICDKIGAQIEVRNRACGGAEFKVTLPK